MNPQDQVIYRCINTACARPMPRRVDFCPYCGTAQHEGALRRQRAAVNAALPAPSSSPSSPPSSPPAPPLAPVAPAPPFVQTVAPAPSRAPLAAAATSPPPPKAGARAAPAGPALRKPIRLRYWLVTLAVLAGIWFMARPAPKKIEARIEQATLQAEDCNLKQARAELDALRNDKASEAQLLRLRSSINAAANACERKQARASKPKNTPKRDSGSASASAPARAAAPVVDHPASQSARNLIAEAERELALGNYKAASDKLETCIAMVEGSRECAAFKKHADRLLRDKQNCMATGRDWTSDRCM